MAQTSAKNLIFPAALLGISGIYFACLPLYVQGGDTAELYTAARMLLVAHPPGYPLWIWLQNLWMHLVPVSTDFWRASLLSCIFSLNALTLLLWPVRRSAAKIFILAPLIAFAPPFFESAILPDVFSLHALFTVLIAVCYLYTSGVQRARCLPFLFMLAAANHLTVIFLLPLLAHAFWSQPAERKIFLRFAAIGTAVTASLYLSLFLMHPNSPYSWGRLESLSDLIHHVLRADYGVFQLQARAQPQYPGPSPFADLIRASLWPLMGVVGFCTYFLFRRKLYRDKTLLVLGFTFLFSLTFFFASNIPPVGVGREVLLRFHLMPLLLLGLCCTKVLRETPLTRAHAGTGLLLTLIFSVFYFPQLSSYLHLRTDAVIEDYARNLVHEVSHRQPALILADNDSEFFAIRDILASEAPAEKIAVATRSMFFYLWFQNKTKAILPTFEIPDGPRVSELRKMNLLDDLITPTLTKGIEVITTSGFQNGVNYNVTFLALGRALQLGKGVNTDRETLSTIKRRTFYTEPPQGPLAYTRGLLYSRYSHFYLMTHEWEAALKAVPYAYPALAGICALNSSDPRCSPENQREIRQWSAPYF